MQLPTTELETGELEFAVHPAQVAAAVAATTPEYVPATQLMHAALPVTSLYMPAAHGEHTPPFTPVYPALQVQSATASLELGELELPGHVTQVAAAVAADVAEYVPAPQDVHPALPLAIL